MRLLFLLLFVSACSAPEAGRDAARDTPEREQVLSLLAQADTSTFRHAYDRLADFTYSRYERTTHAVGGTPGEAQTRIARVADGAVQTLGDTGAPAGSGLQRAFAPPPADARDLSRYVLPSDPAYLQPRHYDAYDYRLLPDTLLGNLPVQVVEITARPDADPAPSVRQVRYYLHRDTHAVLAARLYRRDDALGFSEASTFFLRIRPLGETYVPDVGRFSTTSVFPLRAPRRFERALAYYAFTLR